ncbi:uncharacterized protein LOC143489515 [Brachyhypopomus gauderio]|uniref:uncharacterized protein LOC143489515 n=1 Tax=Brachyhypopomus gauderio TaxID=698409 RepID=UPI004042E45A
MSKQDQSVGCGLWDCQRSCVPVDVAVLLEITEAWNQTPSCLVMMMNVFPQNLVVSLRPAEGTVAAAWLLFSSVPGWMSVGVMMAASAGGGGTSRPPQHGRCFPAVFPLLLRGVLRPCHARGKSSEDPGSESTASDMLEVTGRQCLRNVGSALLPLHPNCTKSGPVRYTGACCRYASGALGAVDRHTPCLLSPVVAHHRSLGAAPSAFTPTPQATTSAFLMLPEIPVATPTAFLMVPVTPVVISLDSL